MSGARWRKVRADLWSNKLRSALAIMSLAVGAAAVGGMFLAGTTIGSSFTSSLAASNPPSAMLITSPFAGGLVDDVAAHPGVQQVEGRRLHQVQVTDADGVRRSVQLVAMTDFAQNDLARIEPVDGMWPPAPGAIVLERASLPELGLGFGEDLEVERPGDAPLPLTVSGSASDVYEVAPMVGGSIRGYVAIETMVELTGSAELDALYLQLADTGSGGREAAVRMTAAVRDEVLAPAGATIAFTRIDQPGEHPADNAITFVTLAMQLLSLLALAIAIGLVVSTVAALLAQQRQQLGVMKALGASTRQLVAQYLASVVLLGLAATAVAVPAGLAGGRLVAGFLADLVNIDLDPMGVPFATVALQMGIAILVPLAAVVLSVRRACRTTVQEAITDRGLTRTVRVRGGDSRFARPTVLAWRNAVRNRLRLGLTVLTVALSGAVLVAVISTSGALSALTDQVAGYTDFDLAFLLTDPAPLAEAVETFDDHPAVSSVEGWYRAQAFRQRPDGTENDDIELVGLPVGSRSLDPTLLEGRWLDADDQRAIVINTHLAEAEPDLEVGGQLLLEVEGHRQRWQIVGISTTTLVGPVAYVPFDDLTAALDAPGDANLLAFQLASDADPSVAGDRLAVIASSAGLPIAAVQTNAELREATDGMFAIVVLLLLLVGVILAVVAVIGVAGTMTLGVVEQTREIGVLRTVGASTRTVRRMFLAQGLAIAGIGAVAGVLLSIPVSLLLGSAIGSSLISADFPFSFSWLGVMTWIVVALLIGALGATQPARVASRLTIRDTLAYE